MAQAAWTDADAKVCPTPDKLWFEDKKSATTAARVQGEKFQKPHRAYECVPGCGRWHLTTKIFGDFRDGHLTDRPALPASLLLEMKTQQAAAGGAVPERQAPLIRRPAPAVSSVAAEASSAAVMKPAGGTLGAGVPGPVLTVDAIQGASIDDLVRIAADSGDRQCEAIAARMRRDAAFLYTLLEDIAAEAQDEAEAEALREQLEEVERRLRDSRAARAVRQTAMVEGKGAK